MGGADLGGASAGAHLTSSPGELIGRDRELSHGIAVLDGAASGHGSLLLISGEPGIGKSRFADELARRGADRGFQVLWGRCWEAGGAPAYWPWVQSLRSLMRTFDADTLRVLLGEGAPVVSQLIPEVRGALGDLQEPPALDPDAARFRLFDSVATFIKRAAATQPLMLVLDDLHVADTPSLLLLQFLASGLGADRMLVVATYRDVDPTLADRLAMAIAEMLRCRVVSRLSLHGMSQRDVPRFIEAVTGIAPDQHLARAVHDQTEGNPLFLEEMARMLLEEGSLRSTAVTPTARVAIPRTVREVIARRLRPLDDECLRVLELASVLGREFSIGALSRLAGRREDEVLDILEAPLAEHVVTEVPDGTGRLRFGHVLIRESLYDSIGAVRRRQTHRAAVDLLEEIYGDDLDAHLSELAHHAFEGAADGEYEKAIGYARRAGDQALAVLAYEEAVRLQRLALDGLTRKRGADAQQRCDVLLSLGDAQTRAGDEAGAKTTFLLAVDAARRLGRPQELATAALGYGGRHPWKRAASDASLVPLLEEAVAVVGEADSALRAKLLARLAGALRDDPRPERRVSLGRQAVDMARRLGDNATLGYALDGLCGAMWSPDNLEERIILSDEIIRLGETAPDPELVMWGRLDRLQAQFELGQLHAVHAELGSMDRLAGALHQPFLRWIVAGTRTALAFAEGGYNDAERLVADVIDIGMRSTTADALAQYTGWMFQLRWEQGRLAEVEDLVQQSARDFTWYPVFRCELAMLHVELGRERQARSILDEIAADDFGGVPFDCYWIFNMSLLGEVAWALHDGSRAAILYERLLPYAGRVAVAPPEGCTGSVSRSLGLLAETSSRIEDAIRHFRDAIAHNERIGARPWLAHAQHDLAALLIRRGDRSDRTAAVDLLTESLRACDEIGMPALRTKVVRLLEHQGATPAVLRPERERVPAEAWTLRSEGEYWTIVYEGRTLRLRDSKGMRLLVRLLVEPNRPQPSLDLERLGAGGDETLARAAAAGDAGELLDDQARHAYRARITELREEIVEAEAWGKADQAGALREELEFIRRELGRGLGLGGRARRAGSVSERARLNVSRALKSAIQRIVDIDAGLGAHLTSTVRTGTVCVYEPDARSTVEWRLET